MSRYLGNVVMNGCKLDGSLLTPPLVITTIASPVTLAVTDPMFVIVNSAGAITLQLPSAPQNGQRFIIINYTTNVVTLTTNNVSHYFDGSASVNQITLNRYDRVNLFFYGTYWFTF